MNLRLLHRRLAVLMGLAGLVGFAGGAGVEPLSTALGGAALLTALFWQPDSELSARMERIWLPLASILVLRAVFHVAFVREDIVIPVVDLLLLLLAAEALRSLEAPNDLRLYALSFALVLASTAYRPGVVFLIAFVGYIGIATLALMVGHLRRRAERHGIRFVPLGRELVLTTVGLSSVILVVALVVFVSFPRVTQGWAGRGETSVSSIAGFSDQVSIGDHGSAILANPEIVLRVEFPGGVPDGVGSFHWRGRSYDRFDGVRWTRSNSLPPSGAPTAWYREQWGGPEIEQRIFGTALQTRVLFALHPAVDLDADNGIQPLFDNAGDFIYWGSGSPAYTAISRSRQPPVESLRSARRGYRPSAAHYLQLPRGLNPRIRSLADSLTSGLDNRYDQAIAIREWLRTFDYTRQLPATARQATLEYFLFDRRAGHCEYFSTAMVVLLRAAGIEARNVNGFLGGQWSEFGNYLVVTQNEAHSWVEAWFPGHGWVTFDPTPAGSGGSVTDDSWFWPGRIFFDGIQHRWSKWVLDYSMDDQVGIFAQLLNLEVTSATIDNETDRQAGRSGPLSTVVMVLTVVLGIAVLVRLVRLRASALPTHTRAYRALRNAADRFGVAVHPGTTPHALVTRIRAAHPAAAAASSTVVDLYLRARFGGESLDDGALREMRSALGAARRGLKTGE